MDKPKRIYNEIVYPVEEQFSALLICPETPSGKVTKTSAVVKYDPVSGWIETMNTIYVPA